jgi:hypothetical protein
MRIRRLLAVKDYYDSRSCKAPTGFPFRAPFLLALVIVSSLLSTFQLPRDAWGQRYAELQTQLLACPTQIPCPTSPTCIDCDLSCFSCETDLQQLLEKVRSCGISCDPSTHTPTATPTNTPSATHSHTPTETPLPTETATPLPTVTPSLTASPTLTFSPSPTYTPFPTETPTFPPSATATPIPSPTHTYSASPTDTPLPTRTPTSSPTQTASPTPSPTHTHSASPTDTPLPTRTPTSSPTQTGSPTPSPTHTYSASPTETPLPTQTPTSSPTITTTPTSSPSATNTATHTPRPTSTPSITPSPTETPVDTPTNTPTFTPDTAGVCLAPMVEVSCLDYQEQPEADGGPQRVTCCVSPNSAAHVCCPCGCTGGPLGQCACRREDESAGGTWPKPPPAGCCLENGQPNAACGPNCIQWGGSLCCPGYGCFSLAACGGASGGDDPGAGGGLPGGGNPGGNPGGNDRCRCRNFRLGDTCCRRDLCANTGIGGSTCSGGSGTCSGNEPDC